MGKTAMSKLEEARQLDSEAAKLTKGDPESSRSLRDLARTKRKAAIRQMRSKRPSRRKMVLKI